MHDKIMKISCVRPGRNQQNNRRFILQSFPVCLLNPLCNIAIGGIAEDCTPPQFCTNPFCSFVKNRSHLWFSLVAQGSSVKPNSASNESNTSFGVSHSSLFEENKTLSIFSPLPVTHPWNICLHPVLGPNAVFTFSLVSSDPRIVPIAAICPRSINISHRMIFIELHVTRAML